MCQRDAKELQAAITKKCLDCSNGMRTEVTRCRVKSCPLYTYRPYQSETARERETRKNQLSVFEVLEAQA